MSASEPSRILITGISGFVGPYLARACLQQYPGVAVSGVMHGATHDPQLQALPVSLIHADIMNRTELDAVIGQTQPDIIFHLAAQSSVAQSWKDPLQTLMINAGGTINLFEAVIAHHLHPRIIVVGSGEQYGIVPPEANPISEEYPNDPTNPYAISKVAQDLYARQYFRASGLEIIRVRPFNHFGPYQTPTFAIPSFCQQIARIEAGKDAPVVRTGTLNVQRDFLPVQDVVMGYIILAEQGHPGAVYNIGSGQPRFLTTILDQLLRQAHIPITQELDAARARPIEIPILVADTGLIQAHTTWRPRYDFDAALRETLDYWRASEGTATV